MALNFVSRNLLKSLNFNIRHNPLGKVPSLLQCRNYSTKNIITSKKHADPIVGVTMAEYLEEDVHKWENALAFECIVTGRKYTHKEIFKYGKSFAVALKQHGLKEGDTVTTVMHNNPEFPIVIIGLWKAGLIISPFNPVYTADEIERQVNACEAKVIITTNEVLSTVQAAVKKTPSVKSIIIIGKAEPGCHSFFEMIKVNSQGVDFIKGSQMNTVEDLSVLPFSSGTTGPPKGVMLTHSNICTNLYQALQPECINTLPFTDGNPQERLIGVLPFFHIYG